MAAASVLAKVREQYPNLAFLLNDPEIGKLLTQAVDPNKGFSATTFQAKLYQTNWWKRRSKSSREWTITAYTDPGEALQKRRQYNAYVTQLAQTLGVKLTSGELKRIREMALHQGLAPDDIMVRNALLRLPRGRKEHGGPGAWTTTVNQLRASAKSEYLTTLSNSAARQWTTWILSGTRTEDDFKAQAAAAAIKRYPHMADQIKQGMTPGEVIEPYRAIIAEELELGDSSRVNLGDPRWANILGILDPKSKKKRLPTESEVIKMARSSPEYWKTNKGRQSKNGFASSLLQMFGKRAGVGGGG